MLEALSFDLSDGLTDVIGASGDKCRNDRNKQEQDAPPDFTFADTGLLPGSTDMVPRTPFEISHVTVSDATVVNYKG